MLTNEQITKKPGRRSVYPGAEKLLKEYETLPASAIAKEYGVAKSTVRGWIRRAREEMVEDGKAS